MHIAMKGSAFPLILVFVERIAHRAIVFGERLALFPEDAGDELLGIGRAGD